MLDSPYRSSAARPRAKQASDEPGLAFVILFGVMMWLLVSSLCPSRRSALDWGGGSTTSGGHAGKAMGGRAKR